MNGQHMWHELWVAICLVMVIEGILPFVSPGLWRESIMRISQLGEQTIRWMGLASMLIGTVLLYWIN